MKSVLALALLSSTLTPAQPVPAHGDWHEVRRLLSAITDAYTAPPALSTVQTTGYTAGLLLGNGDLHVAADARDQQQTYYLSKSDFWHASNGQLPFGTITIGAGRPVPGTDPNYRERQDILNAEVQGAQTVGGQVLRTRTWAADGTDLLVTELSTDESARPLPLQVDLAVPAGTTGVAGDGQVWITRATGADGDTGWVSKAAASARIVGAKATASTPSSNLARLTFTLPPGKPVRLVTSVHGNGAYADPTPLADFVRESVTQVTGLRARDLDDARSRHRDWWKRFWLKSYVDTGDATLNKYYYGALYAMGAASREGFFMSGTYSPWRTIDQTGAANRYWLNYNTEAQYYGVYSANRPELAAPYYKAVSAELPYARNQTHAAGYQGLTFGRTFTPFNATRPAPAEVPVAAAKQPGKLSDQKTNGTFAAIPFMWNWEYTGDKEFLRTSAYPLLKELGAFWMDFVEKGDDGKYHILHSAVNEGGDDVDSTYDLGYMRRTLTALIDYSKELGVDAELRPVWKNYLDDLAPYPTATMDGLDVILLASKISNPIKGNAVLNKNDQPINLEGVVYPGDNLAIGGDPELLRRVRATLQWVDPFLPGSRGSSINGFPKTFTIAARAGWDPEDLIGKFTTVIKQLWRPNLTVRQSGGGQETSGSIETIDSMFLQTYGNVIRVFPEWPAGRDGRFVRLRAKGAFLISAERKAGQEVSRIELTSEHGGKATVANPWTGHRPTVVDVSDHRKVTVPSDGSTFSFDTVAGHTYTVSA
ncbi:glycosyl hydrolase family 95 catalytic domain-containing protein [Actinoallomurus sp. CA-150999]|uniref:glycosyl hydrolase family 95 catalytic domain-containing protein n=1 Tax=Actinoallomurus sp. CA-150999 TaxID=3239887 RepID=UPI003D8AB64C